jgi:hypothetical protein
MPYNMCMHRMRTSFFGVALVFGVSSDIILVSVYCTLFAQLMLMLADI